MKAVILCGGYGTRLKDETEYRPKPLVEIGGMPILWHIMKIYSSYGVKEFILCLGYKGNMIKEYFLNFEELANNFTLHLRSKKSKIIHHNKSILEDWIIHFVDTGLDTQTGGRIAKVKFLLENDDTFFLTYGDGVSNINITNLHNFHLKKKKILTLTAVQPQSPFGIIDIDNNVVTSFNEKPKLEGRINGGFFVCNKKLFDYVAPDKDCIFEIEPLEKLTKDKQIAAYVFDGFWYAMDNQKHVDELNRMWNTNPLWKVW